MWPDLRAELIVQTRRPANSLLLAAAAGLTVAFGYAVPYAGHLNASPPQPGALTALLPAEFAGVAIGGLPAFIGSLALIFGVLVVGGEYAWQTWKTLLVQHPSRERALVGKVALIAIGALALVCTLLATCAATSITIAWIEGADTTLPSTSDILQNLAAGWLVGFTWGMVGMVLAVLLRAVALPVGIGLVWMLAVQNLITALAAPLFDWVVDAQKWLPGPAAGSLVAALGSGQNAPGVAALGTQTQATLVLLGYATASATTAFLVLRRRDLN